MARESYLNIGLKVLAVMTSENRGYLFLFESSRQEFCPVSDGLSSTPHLLIACSLQSAGEEAEDDDHLLPDGAPALARLSAARGGPGGTPGVRLSVRPAGRPQLPRQVQ